MTSPPVSVVLIAAAKLRQGDVTVHGFASFPCCADTNVRAAWAHTVSGSATMTIDAESVRSIFIRAPSFGRERIERAIRAIACERVVADRGDGASGGRCYPEGVAGDCRSRHPHNRLWR